jgi:LPS sulfotransferase NodH
VIGTKLMWPQYRALARDGRHYLRAKGSDAEVVRTLIGPFQVVRLSRRNRLRQAISLVRAEATGVWSLSGAARPRSDGPEPEYDSAAIARALSEIDRQERAWRAELDEIGAPVLEILYEDLLASYEGSVKQTLEFLGLPYAGPLPPPQLRPQADPITEEWVERARRELGTR